MGIFNLFNFSKKDNIPDWCLQKIQEAKERQLEQLDLSNNLNTNDRDKLTKIPEEIFKLKHLKVLKLSQNRISRLPETIENLSNLTTLDLSENKLASLPQSFGNLFCLTRLFLKSNYLTCLPESFGNLIHLTRLDLRENKLASLPQSFGKLTNLATLDLGSNCLASLPESFSKLEMLTILLCENNKLTYLPESFGSLTRLTRLFLENNKLTYLPESLSRLTRLTKLDLKRNPLVEPPPEIVDKGIEEIINYLRQLKKEGKDYIYEAKLLIVGEPGAGKTTLAKKIQNPEYQLQENQPSTEGIEVIKWSFPILDKEQKEREFKVNIWDFGGQEIYHATHQFFLTKRSLYALVTDTRKEDTDFYYWLNVVELLSDNSPILIIKNEKQDRYIDIEERRLRGEFTNLKEILATNLKNNRELDVILDNIKHYIKQLPHVGSPLPKTWVDVRKALEANKNNYVSLDNYLEICRDNGFTKYEDALQLSQYLHDLGVCLHFQDDPILNKTVILKPEWGTDAVYKVLDNKKVINNLGRFSKQDLANIWSDTKYQKMHNDLLQLMIRFKLCYEIPNSKDNYIAPQLLSKNQPNYDWNYDDILQLRYSYEFMPKGILTRFIVEMHKDIYQELVWRNGVVLSNDFAQAEVIEDYGKKEIRIRINGSNKKDLMTIVTHEIDKINDSYERIKYNKLIPCNCPACVDKEKPHFYRLQELKQREAYEQEYIGCGQPPFHQVKVLDLMDDVIPSNQIFRDNLEIKIFLASSSELKDDRKEFEILIGRENKQYIKKNIFLELVIWEDFIDVMSATRLQDEYNKAIEDCDIFVSLFHTKVGKYTEEEFLKALETFKANGKPWIYTYFKDEAVNMSNITPNIVSLINFKQKLSDLGHFYTKYADINDLKYKFTRQLAILLKP